MKKRISTIIVALSIMVGMAGCGGGGNGTTAPTVNVDKDTATPVVLEDQNEVPETNIIRWNSGTSGNVLLTIAGKMGYFEEEGLIIQEVSATSNADAMVLLSTGKVDIVSNSGTSSPLQQISAGVDLTIFGGHMLTGCMPIVALKGTEWNGPQDLIGKKFACNPSYYALTGAIMDLGYEQPLEAVEWISYTDYNDALAAVIRGEVDYALMGTGQNYIVQNMDEIEIMCYQTDFMPNYSCCRIECSTEFLEQNPTTIKLVLKALIRAQCYYEENKDEAVTLLADEIGTSEDYVAAYMLNDDYVVSVDPLKNSIVRAWDILDSTGFLNENAKNINISDYINTELYEIALKEVAEEYGDESPEFYNKMLAFYEESNT